MAKALAWDLPLAVTRRVSDSFPRDAWLLVLQRTFELNFEIRTLMDGKASELERSCAYGRLVALDGPLLRSDAHQHVAMGAARRAAKHATALASEMAHEKSTGTGR